MHTVDVIVGCAAGFLFIALVLILARQRFMLRAPGAFPIALRTRTTRWQYGVGRYAEGELRWYRSLGLGTRPSRVFRRSHLSLLGRREPQDGERHALPTNVVIVECRDGAQDTTIALGESAYTGFVSWLEASAPKS